MGSEASSPPSSANICPKLRLASRQLVFPRFPTQSNSFGLFSRLCPVQPSGPFPRGQWPLEPIQEEKSGGHGGDSGDCGSRALQTRAGRTRRCLILSSDGPLLPPTRVFLGMRIWLKLALKQPNGISRAKKLPFYWSID